MDLEARLPLSVEERERRARLLMEATEQDWLKIAGSMTTHTLQAYANGEINFLQLMEITRASAIACSTPGRIQLLGIVADKAVRIEPIVKNASPPPFPITLQAAAVDLMVWLKDVLDLPVAPRGDRGDSVTSFALEWLKLLRLFPVPKAVLRDRLNHTPMPEAGTLYRWYREHIRDREGVKTLPSGRPRKK